MAETNTYLALAIAVVGFLTACVQLLRERKVRKEAERTVEEKSIEVERSHQEVARQRDKIDSLVGKVDRLKVAAASGDQEQDSKGALASHQMSSRERQMSVLTVGVGGSGKTSFIASIFGNATAGRPAKTEDFMIYSSTIEPVSVSAKRSSVSQRQRVVRAYVSDYRGQNLGSLVSGMLVEQAVKNSPLAYGSVRALVIVVDVVPPPKVDGWSTPPNQDVDLERVGLHNEQWNGAALEAVFGLLASSLAYVCLLVNKIDALKPALRDGDQLRSHFQPIESRLKLLQRDNNFMLDVHVGSMLDGTATRYIRQALVDHAEEAA